MMPSDISLPLKTTISSRIRTIWPMTALNPISIRAALTADAGPCGSGPATEWIRVFIRAKLESRWIRKARAAKKVPEVENYLEK